MEQNGKSKFYLRLSFYTILCTIVYAILVIFLFSRHILLRNKVNIIISFIIIVLVGFSIFQNIVTKSKGNNLKLIIMILLFVMIFGLTGVGNKLFIDHFVSDEIIKKYRGDEYIVVEKGSEEYYFRIYSDLIRSSIPKYSISEHSFEDDGVKYVTSTVVEFDNNGSVANTSSDTNVERGV